MNKKIILSFLALQVISCMNLKGMDNARELYETSKLDPIENVEQGLLYINGSNANKFYLARQYNDYAWIKGYLALSLNEDDFVDLGKGVSNNEQLTNQTVIPFFWDELAVRQMHQEAIDRFSVTKINGKSWQQLNSYEKHRLAEQVYLARKNN